ncbi:DNA-dependent RNA polymerase [compost metagenome]
MQLFSGKQYLQMDIASAFGLDNTEWDNRLAWFEEHKNKLDDMLKQAKEPAMYFAAVQAWRDVQAGKPSGYPISLDATCSGLQILSILTGDRSAASLCNVINTGKREDAYKTIYIHMVEKLGEQAKISRDKTKNAILTSLYGSEAIPKQVFGEGKLLYTFMETMATDCPAAWKLNQFYLSIWNPEALVYSWVLPDNWHVRTKVIGQIAETVHFDNMPFDVYTKVNMPVEKGRSLGANTTHSIDGMIVREMVRRCMYNPEQVEEVRFLLMNPEVWSRPEQPEGEDYELLLELLHHYETTGYLSARILDCIGYHTAHLVPVDAVIELINSLPKKPFQLITIHDCFRCLPNYGNDLRRQYNLQLHLIAKSKLLSSILSQIMGQPMDIEKLDPTLADDILEADYALS